MKKILALTLALTLLLCGCGGANAAAPETTAAAPTVEQTQAPTTEPTTVPTTEPEVYRNPLNGEVLDAPFTDRIFANTVSNMQDNLPHVGVTQADILIETFVNKNNIIRCLALFSNIEDVEAIGSTRSTRPIFNQIAQHYDLVLSHAGGSSQALDDAKSRGIDNFNIDSWEVSSQGTSYRDTEYNRTYENTLFGVGSGIKAYAEAQGEEGLIHGVVQKAPYARVHRAFPVGSKVEGKAVQSARQGDGAQGKAQHDDEKAGHHDLDHALYAPAKAEAAHQKAENGSEKGPEGHARRVGQHGRKGGGHLIGGKIKRACGRSPHIKEHPARHGDIEHHEQIAAHDAEPAHAMP